MTTIKNTIKTHPKKTAVCAFGIAILGFIAQGRPLCAIMPTPEAKAVCMAVTAGASAVETAIEADEPSVLELK